MLYWLTCALVAAILFSIPVTWRAVGAVWRGMKNTVWGVAMLVGAVIAGLAGSIAVLLGGALIMTPFALIRSGTEIGAIAGVALLFIIPIAGLVIYYIYAPTYPGYEDK